MIKGKKHQKWMQKIKIKIKNVLRFNYLITFVVQQ